MESPLAEGGAPAEPGPYAHIQTWQVLGVRVDAVTMAQTLAHISAWVEEARQRASASSAPRTRHVVTLNPEMVMAAQVDMALRNLINTADLVVPDGVGILWASRWRGRRMPERVTGADCVVALANLASRCGWRLFLLGAAPGIAGEAARRLCARFPGLSIAGTFAGSPDPSQDAHTTGLIRASAADVVCVAYGTPHQEQWIARNRDRLGAAVAIGVGGTLDFLAGRIPRAPAWMRRMGIEWAFRLWHEPWRWRRMLALPQFVIAVWREKTGRTERDKT